jgi:hypothetical protein
MPLEGIRVIDWTLWQQGPVCSAMLGDLGADVIKIEARGSGDPGRGILKIGGVDLTGRPNFYFEANNRNKRSITLDLAKPQAREIVYGLAAKSDVFVQNFRKGVAARLGIDYDSLRQHNPKLIYANASGYGPEGRTAPSLPSIISGWPAPGSCSPRASPTHRPRPSRAGWPIRWAPSCSRTACSRPSSRASGWASGSRWTPRISGA